MNVCGLLLSVLNGLFQLTFYTPAFPSQRDSDNSLHPFKIAKIAHSIDRFS